MSCSKVFSFAFLGNEGVLPRSGRPLRPVPGVPGCQGLFRTQEHALLR